MNPWEHARLYAEKQERLVIGLMSGTSVDGVDAALVRISGSARETRVTQTAFETLPFPPALRARVLAVNHGEGNAETLSRLGFDLGFLWADAVGALIDSSGIAATDIDLIASHGQTVSHTAPHATLQIGEASFLAQRFNVPVVSDFRTADVAAGGQGAPLVPYADWCLLTHPTKSRAIQNIGGIGNVTYLPANAAPENVSGFDTGPGNMLIDRATQWATDGKRAFDENGWLAERGLHWSWSDSQREQVLERLLSHPFLRQTPPKSAGREEFGELYWQQIRGGQFLPGIPTLAVSILTEFTAASIADAYRRFLPAMPDEVIVGGGGARNPTLMRLLAERLSPIPVRNHEELGINSDSKEAIAFALLGNETMLGNPSNLPSVTGARRRMVLGKITLP